VGVHTCSCPRHKITNKVAYFLGSTSCCYYPHYASNMRQNVPYSDEKKTKNLWGGGRNSRRGSTPSLFNAPNLEMTPHMCESGPAGKILATPTGLNVDWHGVKPGTPKCTNIQGLQKLVNRKMLVFRMSSNFRETSWERRSNRLTALASARSPPPSGKEGNAPCLN